MTYLLHNGERLCDACFAKKDNDYDYIYERHSFEKPSELSACDTCKTHLLVSREAVFQQGAKSLPQLLAV